METVTEFLRSSPFAFYTTAVIAAFSYISLSFFRSRRRYSPPLPPGPMGVPILGYLPFLYPDLHIHFAKLAAEHGPIFRLHLGGKLCIVVSSAAAAREILREQDVTFAHRDVPAAASVITYGGSDIVWSSYGPVWRTLRKVCIRDFLAGHTLDAFYELRRREVHAMLHRVAQRARTGEMVNFGKEAFLTVMAVLSRMLWGAGEGAEMVDEEFKDVVAETMVLVGTPNISDFFPWLRIFDLQRIEKKMWALRKRLDRIYERFIAARERSYGGNDGSIEAGFLDVMLRLEKKGSGDGKTSITRSNTKAILMDMVIAGTDTTTNTVEFAMAEMMNRPETIRKAQEELDKVVGRNSIVEESIAMKLPYLMAIIKETLRLHPTAPLLVPHCASADCVVQGYTVPAGTRVFVNAWVIHHDPTTWEDPFTFNPERFLRDEAAPLDFRGSDLSYIPFGSGRRICPGSAMGERTLAYVLATLLHAFDWQLPDETSKVAIEERFGLVVKLKKSLLLVPRLRLPEPTLYQ